MGYHWRRDLSDIDPDVADAEVLHRRVHPHYVKPDGSVSSQAFTHLEMSVDRSSYCTPEQTLSEFPGMGIASFIAALARGLNQEVVSAPTIFNPAHALVKGKKTKRIAKSFARAAQWVVPVTMEGDQVPPESLS
jgi:hypothetical protein